MLNSWSYVIATGVTKICCDTKKIFITFPKICVNEIHNMSYTKTQKSISLSYFTNQISGGGIAKQRQNLENSI